MKVKTSITLSPAAVKVIDKRARQSRRNRSAFIEEAVRSYLGHLEREERDKADLRILNEASGKLNDEASDVLSYQVGL